jgi:radical SAM superfamily enzyme YgiQ (UPF0313 family)
MHFHRHILLVYPKFPITFWGMHYTLDLLGKKSAMPPLGLITIAALTPPSYEFRLADLNCEPLSEEDLEWADMVCFSAMLPQRQSLFEVASHCRKAGKLIVFGGPYPTACSEECAPYCDVRVLNEGEITWPLFLADLERGQWRAVYTTEEKPDVTQTPVPRFDLLHIDDYVTIPIQYSRGCPFQCEFCDIIVMLGRRPRTKTPEQICAELDALNRTGFRGNVFIVDDNFIGNKREVKKLLPCLRAWNEAHGNPFSYGTEASINLADDAALLESLVAASFHWVFVGIESPSVESLKETLKFQNTKRSLEDSVRAIQDAGLFVEGGFIVGFDSDTEDIFGRQIEFITRAAIAIASVGLLVALPGTPLFRRLREAGRLRADTFEGDGNRHTNIVTKLPLRQLLTGYRRVMATIYTPAAFFSRTTEAVLRLRRPATLRERVRYFLAFQTINSNLLRREGRSQSKLRFAYRALTTLPAEFRRESLKFLWTIARRRPEMVPGAFRLVFFGLHLCRFSAEYILPGVDAELERLPAQPAPQPLQGLTVVA